MALKQTTDQLKNLLHQVTSDLEKAEFNKAASQRVRTGTIRLEKIAKLFRKESIKFDKSTKGRRKPVAKKTTASKNAASKSTASKSTASKNAASKSTASKKAAPKKMAAPKKAATKKAVKKAAPKKKAQTGKTATRARAMSLKRRQTAKLPSRRASR